jgi:uncharacterized membrane protein
MRDVSRTPDAESSGIDTLVGTILLSGVLLSVLFLVAGTLWRWKNTGHPEFDYTISGMNLLQFWTAALDDVRRLAFRPRLLINLGIGILMATPYLRVLASMLYFAFRERNAKYTAVTGLVLAILSYSLLLR